MCDHIPSPPLQPGNLRFIVLQHPLEVEAYEPSSLSGEEENQNRWISPAMPCGAELFAVCRASVQRRQVVVCREGVTNQGFRSSTRPR
jgi:hypothetical protein